MAKLSNESRLILKLAGERMIAQRDQALLVTDPTWRKGYDVAHDAWQRTLDFIVQELEGPR